MTWAVPSQVSLDDTVPPFCGPPGGQGDTWTGSSRTAPALLSNSEPHKEMLGLVGARGRSVVGGDDRTWGTAWSWVPMEEEETDGWTSRCTCPQALGAGGGQELRGTKSVRVKYTPHLMAPCVTGQTLLTRHTYPPGLPLCFRFMGVWPVGVDLPTGEDFSDGRFSSPQVLRDL